MPSKSRRHPPSAIGLYNRVERETVAHDDADDDPDISSNTGNNDAGNTHEPHRTDRKRHRASKNPRHGDSSDPG